MCLISVIVFSCMSQDFHKKYTTYFYAQGQIQQSLYLAPFAEDTHLRYRQSVKSLES